MQGMGMAGWGFFWAIWTFLQSHSFPHKSKKSIFNFPTQPNKINFQFSHTPKKSFIPTQPKKSIFNFPTQPKKSHNNKIQFSRKEIKPTQTQNKIHPRTINKVSTKSVSHLEKEK
jgi:hypothetical protein